MKTERTYGGYTVVEILTMNPVLLDEPVRAMLGRIAELEAENARLKAVAEAALHVASILRVKVARQEWATPTNLWAFLEDLETPLRAAGILKEGG